MERRPTKRPKCPSSRLSSGAPRAGAHNIPEPRFAPATSCAIMTEESAQDRQLPVASCAIMTEESAQDRQLPVALCATKSE
jgi:hypothetical protein